MNQNKIPHGYYCYDEKGVCPYWSKRADLPEQENGFCSYLNKSDVQLLGGLLWDQVKECGINHCELKEKEGKYYCEGCDAIYE